MVWESILLVFLLGLGTFQVIASWADFKGISFFKHRIVGYVFGIALIIGAFAWFFISVKVGEGGPKGQHDDQALSTVLGGAAALLITLILPSVVKFSYHYPYIYFPRTPEQNEDLNDSLEGIEVFKRMTFIEVIRIKRNRE